MLKIKQKPTVQVWDDYMKIENHACFCRTLIKLCFASQAFFRDVTQEDLHVLLPAYDDPLQDPAYAVPAIGPHFSADDLILSPRATRGLKAISASHANRSIPVSFSSRLNSCFWQGTGLQLPLLCAASQPFTQWRFICNVCIQSRCRAVWNADAIIAGSSNT